MYNTIQKRVLEGVWVNSNGITKLSNLSIQYLRNIYKYCKAKGFPYTLYLNTIEWEINRRLGR